MAERICRRLADWRQLDDDEVRGGSLDVDDNRVAVRPGGHLVDHLRRRRSRQRACAGRGRLEARPVGGPSDDDDIRRIGGRLRPRTAVCVTWINAIRSVSLEWPFGKLACRMYSLWRSLTVESTVVNLMIISFDRFAVPL